MMFPGPFFREEANVIPPGERDMDWEGKAPRRGIKYSFYKKPMASPLGILERSAMGENCKVSTASAELRHKWKNTSRFCTKEEFEGVTRDYVDTLTASGYAREWREKVLTSAVRGYGRILRICQDLNKPRNRPGSDSSLNRRYKKCVGSSEWFHTKEKDDGVDQSGQRDQQKEKREISKGNQKQFSNVQF